MLYYMVIWLDSKCNLFRGLRPTSIDVDDPKIFLTESETCWGNRSGYDIDIVFTTPHGRFEDAIIHGSTRPYAKPYSLYGYVEGHAARINKKIVLKDYDEYAVRLHSYPSTVYKGINLIYRRDPTEKTVIDVLRLEESDRVSIRCSSNFTPHCRDCGDYWRVTHMEYSGVYYPGMYVYIGVSDGYLDNKILRFKLRGIGRCEISVIDGRYRALSERTFAFPSGEDILFELYFPEYSAIHRRLGYTTTVRLEIMDTIIYKDVEIVEEFG